MTKEQAIKELGMVSYGTLAGLTGLNTYAEIDRIFDQWIDKIIEGKVDVSKCETWMDIYKLVRE